MQGDKGGTHTYIKYSLTHIHSIDLCENGVTMKTGVIKFNNTERAENTSVRRLNHNTLDKNCFILVFITDV